MTEPAFEDWTKEAGEMLVARDYASAAASMFGALQALAAERAAERVDPQEHINALWSRLHAPETPYTRAMAAPRLGGQHPHDGRHVMSYGQWGMW